jgi:alpha-1,2-mannosyltransferase
MWGSKNVDLIYPPCDTTDIIKLISLDVPRNNIMVSFAQFRPEKDHQLQLRVWANALPSLPKDSKFILVGATRG